MELFREIEFVEGDIYYYLGDVFENLQGMMTFDGVGFNPFLELTASTKIGDANINLEFMDHLTILSGPLIVIRAIQKVIFCNY